MYHKLIQCCYTVTKPSKQQHIVPSRGTEKIPASYGFGAKWERCGLQNRVETGSIPVVRVSIPIHRVTVIEVRTNMFDKFSERVANLTGSSGAFSVAIGTVVVWLLVGPLFMFSDTWQLLINTPTTVVTFLLLFVVQRTQIKANVAQKVQLTELILAIETARNSTADLDSKSLTELTEIEQNQINRVADAIQETKP